MKKWKIGFGLAPWISESFGAVVALRDVEAKGAAQKQASEAKH